ncbi:MAG TPA: hypothetical protein VGI81_01370, partial [Tepidisphaeraceae bacterium]
SSVPIPRYGHGAAGANVFLVLIRATRAIRGSSFRKKGVRHQKVRRKLGDIKIKLGSVDFQRPSLIQHTPFYFQLEYAQELAIKCALPHPTFCLISCRSMLFPHDGRLAELCHREPAQRSRGHIPSPAR